MKPILISALSALLYISVASPCYAAAPNPTPTDLGVLPGFDSSEARGINASGQVVGYCYNFSEGGAHPFIWQNGVMTALPLPSEYTQCYAESINASGVIVGNCMTADNKYQACLWERVDNAWKVTLLGAPSGFTFVYDNDSFQFSFDITYALKINDAGQVLAVARCFNEMNGETTSVNEFLAGCIWQNAGWSLIGSTVPEVPGVVAPVQLFNAELEMNELGQVLLRTEHQTDEEIGNLVLWDNSTKTVMPVVERVQRASLNNAGQVAGTCSGQNDNGTGIYNFIWDTISKTATFTPIGTEGGGAVPYSFRKINNAGQILVSYRHSIGALCDLGIVPFVGWSSSSTVTTIAEDLSFGDLYFNDFNEVCGYYANWPIDAFYASASTQPIALQGIANSASAQLTGMSSSGRIIGVCETVVENVRSSHAVLWSGTRPVQGKTPVELGALPGDDFSQARAVNASGQVVGVSISEGDNWDFHPFIWENGVLTPLPLPDGCQDGEVTSINALGQIVGWYEIPGENPKYQACRWTFSGTQWDVTPLEGYESSVALKINNAGQILAHGYNSSGSYAACLWDGNSWTVLKTEDTPLIPLQMNEKGQVLATDRFSEGKLFVWANGTATALASKAEYYSLNNLGQVVWSSYDDTSERYVSGVYLPEAAYGLVAGTYRVPGAIYRAINDSGLLLITKPVYEDTDGDGFLKFVKTEVLTAHLDGSPGFTCSIPGAEVRNVFLNAKGEVAGLFTLDGSSLKAGFHISSTGLLQLDSLPEATSLEVIAMNRSGRVIGNTDHHAVLWDTSTPCQNQPPIANAGAGLAVVATGASTAVMLDGSGSSDPDSDSLTYSWTENGTEIATGATPSLNLCPGTHRFTLTVTDPEGLTSTDTVTVCVSYSWSGVLQPINLPNASGVSASVFKAGSTVPVRFALTGASAGVSTLTATFSYAKVGSGVLGTELEAATTVAATAGNLFRYDATTHQYMFNWTTKGLTSGTYRLTINLGDGVPHTVDVGLK
jgi:probable HAF family extracellular repeat protein